jgi:hypothetical protein
MGAKLLNGELSEGTKKIYTAGDILKTDINVLNFAEIEGFNEIYMGEINF